MRVSVVRGSMLGIEGKTQEKERHRDFLKSKERRQMNPLGRVAVQVALAHNHEERAQPHVPTQRTQPVAESLWWSAFSRVHQIKLAAAISEWAGYRRTISSPPKLCLMTDIGRGGGPNKL